jgi:hypothetical protein
MHRSQWTRLGALAALVACALVTGAAGSARVEYAASGTWQSEKGGEPGTWKGTLYRSATSDTLTGTISVDGATAIADAIVDGTMTTSSITFGLLHGGASVAQFSGSASGAAVTGTYRFDPLHDAGTWEGTLVQR